MKNENENKQNKNIVVRCYGKTEFWESREEAITYYIKALSWSDGSEQNRYANILSDLCAGRDYCTDE